MRIINMRRLATLNRNHYFVFGLLLGLALSFYIPQDIWDLVQQEECPQQVAENTFIRKFGQDFEPHLNLINKPLAAKKVIKNVVRPRYYSSELGIREKLFIGVMTSQDSINTLATAINRTTAHLVNRIKFFINAENVKSNYKLKNIVGFTDTRENLRPFHVIKYIADNYLDDYDYFLIMPDTVYIDARKLNAMLYHMSITFDLYMGTRLSNEQQPTEVGSAPYDEEEQSMLNGERNYCDLNAGILLSSRVIGKMRNNLDWCVRNGNSNVHSINIGRCVKYSSKLVACQQSFQNVAQRSFVLKSQTNIYKDLHTLAESKAFREATTVYPITLADDFYRLHAYFSRHHLELVQKRSLDLENKAYSIANGTISNNLLEIRWPLGVQPASAPDTRHDIINWQMLNETHIFLPNNAENLIEPLTSLAADDFKRVLQIAIDYAAIKNPKLKFLNIHTAYRRFDATRGMDYQLHLNFRDTWSQVQVKSYQVVKPLGRVEVIPSPYVTESTRIAILVPTMEHHVNDALNFISLYERICMSNQDNTFLLMIFLYRYNSESKDALDPFKKIKTMALDLSARYKTDGSRIAWVSIRLPPIYSMPITSEELMLTSLYGSHEHLSIAVADLALPKIGLDSLVLMASPSMNFKTDFLNRVRMNTIQGFQIFSPIGFTLYPCKLVNFCKDCESCDVSQGSGYFDKWNNDVTAFYSRDYVQARKRIELVLPIIHSDNDIEQLYTRIDKSINSVLDMFVSSKLAVHVLRGVEPNLRFAIAMRNLYTKEGSIAKCPRQPLESDENDLLNRHNKCLHLASRKQIGDAIIRYEDKSIVHK